MITGLSITKRRPQIIAVTETTRINQSLGKWGATKESQLSRKRDMKPAIAKRAPLRLTGFCTQLQMSPVGWCCQSGDHKLWTFLIFKVPVYQWLFPPA